VVNSFSCHPAVFLNGEPLNGTLARAHGNDFTASETWVLQAERATHAAFPEELRRVVGHRLGIRAPIKLFLGPQKITSLTVMLT
jgi:hypothetical protein